MVARGFSLVEVIVALTLLSVGLLAVAATAAAAARLLRNAEAHEDLFSRAQSVLDSVAANRLSGSGEIRIALDRLEWTASSGSVVVRVYPHDDQTFTLQAVR